MEPWPGPTSLRSGCSTTSHAQDGLERPKGKDQDSSSREYPRMVAVNPHYLILKANEI